MDDKTIIKKGAIAYAEAGLRVVISKEKNPGGYLGNAWQKQATTDVSVVKRWFNKWPDGWVGLCCGDGLEMLDIDNIGSPLAEETYAAWCTLVNQASPGLLDQLVIERTQRGGYHVWYKCQGITAGATKLAKRLLVPDEQPDFYSERLDALIQRKINEAVDDTFITPEEREREWGITLRTDKALIETRGRNGFGVVYPSPGYTVIQGRISQIPTIIPQHRKVLWDAARSLDLLPKEEPKKPSKKASSNGVGHRTGATWKEVMERYNEMHSVESTLERYGYTQNGRGRYVRPGGERALTVVKGDICFQNSSEDVLEQGKPYSAFNLFVEFEHNGAFWDAIDAAREHLNMPGYERRNGSSPKPAGNESHEMEEPAGDAGNDDQHTGIEKIISDIASLGYDFALNEVDDTIECNGVRFDDIERHRLKLYMRGLGYGARKAGPLMHMSAIEEAISEMSHRNRYHPIQDYFNSLVWDGQDRIAEFAGKFTCEDPDVVYKNGISVPIFHAFLTRWMIGVVAKVIEQGQNLMLVWDGTQGIGKSGAARWLCPLPDWFIEEPINTSDKDSDIRLISKLIWEVSELDATTRKADVSALKAFITKQIVTVRKSYGRMDICKPAMASMIGTVNGGRGFLVDDTGNRRFMVVTITAIDWSYTDIDRDQLWAQAVALYRAGVPWTLLPEEKATQNEINKAHEVESPLDGWILKWFDITGQEEDKMTASDILDHLLLPPPDAVSNAQPRVRLQGNVIHNGELRRVLLRLGVKAGRRRCSGAVQRVYLGIKPCEYPNPTIRTEEREQREQPVNPPERVVVHGLFSVSMPNNYYCEQHEQHNPLLGNVNAYIVTECIHDTCPWIESMENVVHTVHSRSRSHFGLHPNAKNGCEQPVNDWQLVIAAAASDDLHTAWIDQACYLVNGRDEVLVDIAFGSEEEAIEAAQQAIGGGND